MPDGKEVIIDGVNVAGCTSLTVEDTIEFSGCDEYLNMLCKGAECNYKKWKLAESENKLLKEELYKKSEQEQSFQSLLDENKELKQENENQKKTIAELLEACNKCDEYNEARFRLNICENTLKEIKDYCKKFSFVASSPIINKIDEVLK